MRPPRQDGVSDDGAALVPQRMERLSAPQRSMKSHESKPDHLRSLPWEYSHERMPRHSPGDDDYLRRLLNPHPPPPKTRISKMMTTIQPNVLIRNHPPCTEPSE
jgi:hypothetical protein